jgi:hypothetical protein
MAKDELLEDSGFGTISNGERKLLDEYSSIKGLRIEEEDLLSDFEPEDPGL